jgi:uncharacterized protein (TIGR02646 family)
LRFIPVPSPISLPIGWSITYARRVAAVDSKDTPKLRSEYIKAHGSWGELKDWLAELSGNKCWYCEAKVARAPLDVDHFRPKLGVTVDGVGLVAHDGYYWLAYEWQNFRLSCQRCNRPEKNDAEILRGKANEFPIRVEACRCSLPTGLLAAEEPRFLDPCKAADSELLAHGIDGEVKPLAAMGTWENERARYTIDQLGFNDWNTPEDKRKQWQSLTLLIDYVRDAATPALEALVSSYLSNDSEYTSFFRSAIGTHRDKPWVETLL